MSNVGFGVAPGTVLGIVGRSGSGKSTITRLLQGIARDYSGQINIDGFDLRDINLTHLRRNFGVVLQDNFLFRGTVAENILAGRPGLTLTDAIHAARLAGAVEFIEKLPNGYETLIEEGSPNLSGGQRQRLAIARALVHDPRVLILDEATSALDPESEALVNANIARMAAGPYDADHLAPPVIARRLRRHPGDGPGTRRRHRPAQRSAAALRDLPEPLAPAEPSPHRSAMNANQGVRAMSVTIARRADAALLEFKSPTAAVVARPIPRSARTTTWVVAGATLSAIAVMGLYPVDKVVTVPGKVVAGVPNIVVQPLDTAIVQQISVHEGQIVHAGDRLATLDPTFAAADATASDAQVASLRAEVDRLEAESEDRPYSGDGSQPSQIQAMIYAQRHAEMQAKLENYAQRIAGLNVKLEQSSTDINSYVEQFRVAQTKESMRRELEHLQVGSRLNTLDADAQRAEVQRALQAAVAARKSARAELDGMIAERDAHTVQFKTEVSQQLAEQGRKLADAEDQARKASLRRRLTVLLADRDAIVLNVAKVSVGSVVQSGDELIKLVPADAPLQIEASIPGAKPASSTPATTP